MIKTVSEEYPELYHYTNAEGLQGIITSQCLRATNITFLNDSEERIHYLDQRMPLVIERAIRSGFDELVKIPERLATIEQYGHEKAVIESRDRMIQAIRQITLTFDEPYVVSFCGTKISRIAQHGLLSQWRAYGADGGYALVFDTRGLDSLLKQESEKYMYLSLKWGDVNYHDGVDDAPSMHEEFQESEEILKSSIAGYLKTAAPEKLDPIYDAVVSLSCLTKHWGFHEEREVRVVAVRGNKALAEKTKNSGGSRPERMVHHRTRGGILIPYISLFDGIAKLPENQLPIKSIIIGPHPDRMKRKKAVELLLEQHGISAEVRVSEIPYLSR